MACPKWSVCLRTGVFNAASNSRDLGFSCLYLAIENMTLLQHAFYTTFGAGMSCAL